MSTGSQYRNNTLTFHDRTTLESLLPVAPVVFADDFLGAYTALPTSAESGMDWISKIVGAAPPTAAITADGANGILELALTATSEKQEATAYFGDQRQFSLEQGVVFECRAKISVLPTGNAEAVFGLLGDWTDGADAATYSLFFTADGSGAIVCEMDDNATDRSTASGVTVLNTEWHIFRIEAFAVGDVRFYIDGAQVAVATTFAYAATGANAVLQPYLSMYKASGTGIGTIQIDYVRAWQNRG